MNGTHNKYDTQELLAMNMDRLKEYMDKWREVGARLKEEARHSPSEAPSKKRITRIVSMASQPRVLLVRPDPLILSRIVRQNDTLLPRERFTFSWGNDFQSSVAKMSGFKFDAVVVAGGSETLKDAGCDVSGLDFLFLVNGLADRKDARFPLKKKAFVQFCVPGDGNEAKISAFRRIKEDYANQPFFFLYGPGESRQASVANRIHGVRILPLEDGNADLFFSALAQVTRSPGSRA